MSSRTQKTQRGDFIILAITIIASFIILVSAHRSGKNSAIYDLTLNIAGQALAPLAQLRELRDIRAENDRLREQNMLLSFENSQLAETGRENARLLALLDLKQYLPYKFIAAKVTGFDEASGMKAVVFNAGREKGVEVNMPVITSAGLAGKIVRVAESYSIGQILNDKNFRAAARLAESRYTGIFEGKGDEMAVMWGVPLTVDITIGEQIISSGAGSFFPEGIIIGRITGVKQDPNRLFHILVIRPQVDYSKLEHVLIIKSKEALP